MTDKEIYEVLTTKCMNICETYVGNYLRTMAVPRFNKDDDISDNYDQLSFITEISKLPNDQRPYLQTIVRCVPLSKRIYERSYVNGNFYDKIVGVFKNLMIFDSLCTKYYIKLTNIQNEYPIFAFTNKPGENTNTTIYKGFYLDLENTHKTLNSSELSITILLKYYLTFRNG